MFKNCAMVIVACGEQRKIVIIGMDMILYAVYFIGWGWCNRL